MIKDVRVGHGYDVHAFANDHDDCQSEQDAGDGLVLGGVTIPFEKRLLAHSDGDVVIHALCDALLGALALGDIGSHFPDSDPQYKNMNSRRLLCDVIALIQRHSFNVGNLNITVVAQRPRLAPHISAMQENLAADCGLERGRVSVKATTTEKLGFAGQELGIACYASVLLFQ